MECAAYLLSPGQEIIDLDGAPLKITRVRDVIVSSGRFTASATEIVLEGGRTILSRPSELFQVKGRWTGAISAWRKLWNREPYRQVIHPYFNYDFNLSD